MWRPVYKQSGRPVDTLLTDEEKAAWEVHPLTRRLYRYEKVDNPPPAKSLLETIAPVEAKRYTPKPEAKAEASQKTPAKGIGDKQKA